MTKKKIQAWEDYIKSLRSWLTKQKKVTKSKRKKDFGPGDHPPPPPPHP